MYLEALSRAVPRNAYSQPDAWNILQSSGVLNRLSTRSAGLLEKVLLSDHGIEQRHFATDRPEQLFSLDAESLNRNFERFAPALSNDALSQALHASGLAPDELDALFVCTCTGYLCPGLSSYIAEQAGLRPDIYLQDIVGLGCGAALPTLRSAQGFLAAQPDAKVACIAVEVCSAAFYLDNDPGVLISACLFGDGASASIWSNDPAPTGYRLQNFRTLHSPENRELLRFTNCGGKLRNQLHRSVPSVAAPFVRNLFDQSTLQGDFSRVTHTGGRDVLDALETALPDTQLSASRETLRAFGNVSSPSVLFTLQDVLTGAEAPAQVWLASFGAGFAAHSCELKQLQPQ